MQEFILLIREDASRMAGLAESDFQAEIEEFVKWVESMTKTGNYLSGDPLQPEGRYIQQDSISSDGPFLESKEVISGYVIKARDMEEAVQLGKNCPIFTYGGLIELRPLMKM